MEEHKTNNDERPVGGKKPLKSSIFDSTDEPLNEQEISLLHAKAFFIYQLFLDMILYSQEISER